MTLLEVALSATILGSVIALILTGYAQMAAAAATAREYGEASQLLSLKLAEVYSAEDLTAVAASGSFAEIDGIDSRLRDAAWRIETASEQTGLARVTVTVTWRSGRGDESVAAETLKFLPDELQEGA